MKENIVVEYAGIEFEVFGDYIPPVPGRMYMRNGDPGYPSEPAYMEDLDIQLNGISLIDVLRDKAIEDIEEKACRAVESMRALQ